MIIKGSFDYIVDEKIEGELPNNTYLFELTDKTEFYGVGADGAFPIKRSDFFSPPSLTLKVLNGKVVRVSSSS